MADKADQMESQVGPHKLEPKIIWKDRPPMTSGEKACGATFYILLLVQIILGIVVLASQNVKHMQGSDCMWFPDESCCDDGYVQHMGMCVKEELQKEYMQCMQDNPTFRRLNALGKERNLWDALEEFPQVPAVLMVCMLVLAGLWLHSLRKFARPICWATILLTLVLLLYMAIRPATAGHGIQVAPLILAVIMVGICVWKRKAVDTAAACISTASTGLEETPSVFAWTALVMLIYVAYLALWAVFMIASVTVWDVRIKEQCEGCGEACVLGMSKLSEDTQKFLGVLFSPTVFFLQNASMIICATGIGAWYFHKEDPEYKDAARTGFRWAWTTSSGTSFFCAIVMYIIAEIKKLANSSAKVCPFHPAFWCWLIMQCFANCMQACTRYMLIAHTFHGDGIRQTIKNSFDVLHRRLGDAVINDSIAQLVLGWSTSIFSTAFGFIAWAWLDDCMEQGLLNTIGDSAAGAGSEILILILVLVMFFFVSRPIFTLVFVAFIGTLIKADILVGFMGGIFIGAICCIFFRYFSAVVLNSSDVIYWCFALEADAGAPRQERFEKVYNMIETQIVVGQPVPGQPAGAAQGTPVAPPAQQGQQMMAVQVPEGSAAGQTLQIQSASGPMNVVIPQGVAAGQTFQVQVPTAPAQAQAVEPAVVGNATQA